MEVSLFKMQMVKLYNYNFISLKKKKTSTDVYLKHFRNPWYLINKSFSILYFVCLIVVKMIPWHKWVSLNPRPISEMGSKFERWSLIDLLLTVSLSLSERQRHETLITRAWVTVCYYDELSSSFWKYYSFNMSQPSCVCVCRERARDELQLTSVCVCVYI